MNAKHIEETLKRASAFSESFGLTEQQVNLLYAPEPDEPWWV